MSKQYTCGYLYVDRYVTPSLPCSLTHGKLSLEKPHDQHNGAPSPLALCNITNHNESAEVELIIKPGSPYEKTDIRRVGDADG